MSLALVSESEQYRRFALDLVGHNPCVSLESSPGIDVHLEIEFRQLCEGGAWKPIEYRVASGQHDGFPWHEMYINGIAVYTFDACTMEGGPSVMSLFGSGEINMLLREPALGQWRPVPGQ
jgi:hypothetical protein